MSTITHTKPQRSFFVRLLIAFLKFGLFIILTAGAVGLSIVVLGEIQRSQARTSNLESQIQLLRSDVNAYVLEPRYAARVTTLEQDTQRAETRLATLSETNTTLAEANTALQTQLADQEAQLADLETQLAALQTHTTELLANTQTITENLAILNNGIGDLQRDLTGNVVGVDDLTADMTALDQNVATLDEAITALQVQMVWERGAFRLWGMLLRAQFYLAADEPEAALATLKKAQTAMTALSEIAPESAIDPLAEVQLQLDSAAETLITDAEEAAVLLQEAWDTLDALLGN